MSLEMESGKDFVTFFEENKKVCFHASKIKYQKINLRMVDDNHYRNFKTFLSDEDEIVETYITHRRNMGAERNKWCYGGRDIVDEDGTDYSKELTKAQKEAIKKRIKPCSIKMQMSKKAMCCPNCHKVHILEDFLVVKEKKKEFMEKLKKEYGPNWYALFKAESALNLYDYFEPICEDVNYSDSSATSNYFYGYSLFYYNNTVGVNFHPKLICPECGCLTNEYEYRSLNIFNKFNDSNSRLVATTIFNDEHKIAVSQLYNSYYINVDALVIAREDYRIRLTFNTDTGQTYFIGPKKLNGKKMSGWYHHRLINLTYRYSAYSPNPMSIICECSEVKKEVFKLLLERNGDSIEKFKNFPGKMEKISEDFKDILFENLADNQEIMVKINTIEDIDFDKVPLTWLTLYNRFPCLNGEQIMNLYHKDFYEGYLTNYFMKDLFKGVKREFTANELLDTICKNVKMKKSKKAKKIFANDLLFARNILVFSRFGFKDINIYYSFIECLKESEYNFLKTIYDYEIENISIFVKDMIKKKGEAKTFKTLFKNNPKFMYIADSARMYVKFKESNMVINEYFTDNIKKIHDRMSRDFPKIKFKNVEIPYPKKASKLNLTLESGYEFTLAKDTNELVRIGQELKICVGGYRDSALSNSCYIISMKEDGKYVGCIELDRECQKLIQAKAVYNNRLQEYKAEALKEWIETLSINTNDCCDYSHIKEGNIEYDMENLYLSGHDYHTYELDEEGNVIHRRYNNNNNQGQAAAINWDDFNDELPFI